MSAKALTVEAQRLASSCGARSASNPRSKKLLKKHAYRVASCKALLGIAVDLLDSKLGMLFDLHNPQY